MRPFVVSPLLPFPNIAWWRSCGAPGTVIMMDEQEHFEKMSFRNRYMVAAADGVLTLSIPLAGGRQQRKAMKDVLICNQTRWQIQHWRSLVSVYGRSPYFEHYAERLQALFSTPFERLVDFSEASIRLMQEFTGIFHELCKTETYEPHYPDAVSDLRPCFRTHDYEKAIPADRSYYQTFGDRHGFLNNLSILDLVFAEGPAAAGFIL
jgi:hypothetical protein